MSRAQRLGCCRNGSGGLWEPDSSCEWAVSTLSRVMLGSLVCECPWRNPMCPTGAACRRRLEAGAVSTAGPATVLGEK